MQDDSKTSGLLRLAGEGDGQALGTLFNQHRDKLRRMVQLRMDPRLQGRLGASDVLQEAYIEVSRALASLRDPALPFFVWLRMLTSRKLQTLHRRHLGTHARDATREVGIYKSNLPEASSVMLAAQLLGRFSSPSQAALRAELQVRIQDALNSMEPMDREILALRHFEQLTNSETAQVLEISESAASNRFVRALQRLKSILMCAPGYFDPAP